MRVTLDLFVVSLTLQVAQWAVFLDFASETQNSQVALIPRRAPEVAFVNVGVYLALS